MCIMLLSTTHPDYPLILLSNRDEFLHRPTQPAAYWDAPHEKVFSGRDLARPERGTWLGVSKNGRIAVLTNYREHSSAAAIGEKSRGAMVTAFLTSPFPVTTPTKNWIHNVLETGEMKGVGGFSMVCGTLRPSGENIEALAVISNRTPKKDDGVEQAAHWIAGTKQETHGLSNTLFDQPWPKVKLGRELLTDTVREAIEAKVSEDELIERCFTVLSHNTLPLITNNDTYETEMDALRLSIFIPPFDAAAEHAVTPHGRRAQSPAVPEAQLPAAEDIASGEPGKLRSNVFGIPPMCPTEASEELVEKWRQSKRLYGTAQQTVILVDKTGRLKYVERTLYDRDARPVEKENRDVSTEFHIEDWPEM